MFQLQSELKQIQNSHHIIPIPEDIGSAIHAQLGKRVICEVNGKNIHCAVQKNQYLGYFIGVGKGTQKKIGAESGEELALIIRKDDTPYQMEMPEVLYEVLHTDPEGLKAFENLTDGKKRSIMHQINSAKSIDTQINRSLKIVEQLKMGTWGVRRKKA